MKDLIKFKYSFIAKDSAPAQSSRYLAHAGGADQPAPEPLSLGAARSGLAGNQHLPERERLRPCKIRTHW